MKNKRLSILVLSVSMLMLMPFNTLAKNHYENDDDESKDQWYSQQVVISEYKLTLQYDNDEEREYELTAYGDPDEEDIKWKSSNTAIATVTNDGLVKAKKKGNCSIIAEGKESKRQATCYVSVISEPTPIEELKATNNGEITVSVNHTAKLPYKVVPSEATTTDKLRYTVKDTDICYVDSAGMVTGREDGETKVTIYSEEDGVTLDVTVTVVEFDDEKLKNFSTEYPGLSIASQTPVDNYIWAKVTDGGWLLYDTIKGDFKSGWQEIKGKWYFLEDAQVGAKVDKKWKLYTLPVMRTGWVEGKNTWYFCSAEGSMQRGWVLNNDKWYYMSPSNGAMSIGRLELDRKFYYLREDGSCVDGWWTDTTNNRTYYSNPGTCEMNTGWFMVDGKYYYPDSLGLYIHKDRWILDNGKEYYLGSDGAMSTNCMVPDGNYVGEDGSKLS